MDEMPRDTGAARIDELREHSERELSQRGLKRLHGKVVLDHEGGNRFYHKHLSQKAKARKRKARKQAKQSRQRNR